MPVIKYAALPTARIEAYNHAIQYKDIAVLDFSTQGHGVYNFGNLTRLEPLPISKSAFCAHITEVDIALGNLAKLKNAVQQLVSQGYKNIYLMPSSLASVLGFDLSSYAEECSAEFGVNVFTSQSRLHDDCFVGAQEILYSLSDFATDSAKDKSGFNLLGGRYTKENRDNHIYIAKVIEEQLGLQLKFDSLNAISVSEWNKVSEALINVVTSKSAIKTAEKLKSKFGMPYVYFMPLGKCNEDNGLCNIAQIVKVDYKSSDDDVYDFATIQFGNILNQTSPKIVCYSDADRLSGLKELFSKIYDSVQFVCSHSDSDFKYMDINDFIENYSNKDCLVISYDRVCKYMKKSVAIEKLGLDYKLLTPTSCVSCGKDGAYSLMEKIVDVLFSE